MCSSSARLGVCVACWVLPRTLCGRNCTTIPITVKCAEHSRDGLGVFGGGLGVFRACRAETVSIPSVTCLTKVRLCICLVVARSSRSACPVGNFANVTPPGLRANRKLRRMNMVELQRSCRAKQKRALAGVKGEEKGESSTTLCPRESSLFAKRWVV